MKKIFLVTILLITFISTVSYAQNDFDETELLIRDMYKSAARCKVNSLKSKWEKLCKINAQTCSEKQEWYNELLFETEKRKHDNFYINNLR